MILGKKTLARGGNSHSLDFDGTSAGVDVPRVISDLSTMTYSIVVKPNVLDGNWRASIGEDESPNSPLRLYIDSNNGSGLVTLFAGNPLNTEIARIDSTDALSENNWYYVVGVLNGTDALIYINGNLVKKTSWSTNLDSARGIGRLAGSEVQYFNGIIDNVSIYNRALSQNEITKLRKGVSISRAGLVGQWNMNKGTGDTAYDSSGNGNHGTLVNNPTWSTDTPPYRLPKLSEPSNLDNSNVGTNSFDALWDSVADADFYNAEIYENSDYTGLVESTETSTDDYTFDGLNDLSNNTYYWRTRADADSGYAESNWATYAVPAQEWFDGFEDGNLDEWTVHESNFQIYSSPTYDGSYSAGIEYDSTPEDVADIIPDLTSGGYQASQFSFYWYENSSSSGGGIRLLNSNGNPEIGFASDNNEWDIEDANGFSQVYGGDGYERWIYVEMTFDWANGNADVYIEDLSSGTTSNNTGRPLINEVNIEKIKIKEYNNSAWGSQGAMYMWFDNLKIT